MAPCCSDGNGAGPVIVGTAFGFSSVLGAVVWILVAPVVMLGLAVETGAVGLWSVATVRAPMPRTLQPETIAAKSFMLSRIVTVTSFEDV